MKRILTLAFAALVISGLTGCVAVATPYGVAVAVPVGHIHDDCCGHYNYGGSCYYWAGHVHGPGCGHVCRGGVWIVGG
jgi:hypothetical protein